jgi:type II secretory pathway pseudopilin PulG
MPVSRSEHRCNVHAGRAFTITELLISIAVIFLLVTTALVGLRAARKGAERTVSLSALRQMMTGYSAYTTDHNGHLLPGYIKPNTIGTGAGQLDIKAKLQSGFRLNAQDTASYVWRLSPYVNHEWKTFMADYGSDSMIARFEEEFGTGDGSGGQTYGPGTIAPNRIGIASHPSFGLNSMFIGGDSFHGPGFMSAGHPWGPSPRKDTISRISQAKNPTKVITFAPTRATAYPTDLGVDVVLAIRSCARRSWNSTSIPGNLS